MWTTCGKSEEAAGRLVGERIECLLFEGVLSRVCGGMKGGGGGGGGGLDCPEYAQ